MAPGVETCAWSEQPRRFTSPLWRLAVTVPAVRAAEKYSRFDPTRHAPHQNGCAARSNRMVPLNATCALGPTAMSASCITADPLATRRAAR